MRPLFLSLLVGALAGASLAACGLPASGPQAAAPGGSTAAGNNSPGKTEGPTTPLLATPNPGEVCNLYFGTYDANKNGVVTRAEFHEAKLIRARRVLLMINADGSSPVVGEGMVGIMAATATTTSAEAGATTASGTPIPFGQGPADTGGPVDPTAPTSTPIPFGQGPADTASGPVNPVPTEAQLDVAFEKMDTNKDNQLTKAEVCNAVGEPLK